MTKLATVSALGGVILSARSGMIAPTSTRRSASRVHNILSVVEVLFPGLPLVVMSESVKPSSIGFPNPYLRQTFEVPFKYLSIHFIATQCSRPGLLIYQLTALIANAMSDLVQIIAYIKVPTTDAFGTFRISALSFSPFGHCLAFNL